MTGRTWCSPKSCSVVRQPFHQPDRAQSKTVAKLLVVALAENDLCAAASHIDNQQRPAGKERGRTHPAKGPVSLLFAGNDLHSES